MQIEEWKEISGCLGYKISNLGNVKGPRGKLITLQQYKGHGRYWFFRMPHKKFTKTIHRLVAEHFVDNPHNYPEVNHKYGDKNDNRAVSLEWCTRSQNMQHAVRTGLKVATGNRRMFNDLHVQVIKECFQKNFTNVSIARYFNCHQSTIWYLRHGASKYFVS